MTAVAARTATRLSSGLGSRPDTSSRAAAVTPTTAIEGRSHGIQSGLRASSTTARVIVTSTVAANAVAAGGLFRLRHNNSDPIPRHAAIAGARATV